MSNEDSNFNCPVEDKCEIGKERPMSPEDFMRLAGLKTNDVIRAINEALMGSIKRGCVTKIDFTTNVSMYNAKSISEAVKTFVCKGWIYERGENGEHLLMSETQPFIEPIIVEDSCMEIEDSMVDPSPNPNPEQGDTTFTNTTPGPQT